MPNYKNDPVVSAVDNAGGPSVQGVNGTLKGIGVYGHSTYQQGVYGDSDQSEGVRGVSRAPGHGAVVGVNDNHAVDPTTGGSVAGSGVAGFSDAVGVQGLGKNWHGVYGESQSTVGGAGVAGKGAQGGVGVFGESPSGIAVLGRGPTAGRFEGDVEVTGDVRLLNADCAEDFDIAHADSVDPGTVMVLANEGALRASHQAYDRRVAGIVSGAGAYKPALVLDHQEGSGNRQPIALMGKVFCKVDAQYGPVEIGDLLTTSPTPGYAMKAADPMKAFGAVLGKALRPLDEGQGLIPVLVSLQ